MLGELLAEARRGHRGLIEPCTPLPGRTDPPPSEVRPSPTCWRPTLLRRSSRPPVRFPPLLCPRCRRPAYRREPTGSLSHRRKSILRAMRLTGKVLLRPIDKSSCTTSVSGCADDTEDDLPTGTARHDGCRIYQDDDDPISGPLVLQPVRLRRICSFRAACAYRPGQSCTSGAAAAGTEEAGRVSEGIRAVVAMGVRG